MKGRKEYIMSIIIALFIAAGLIYCFCYALPLTVREIKEMIKSGFIFNDEWESEVTENDTV